MLYRSVPYRRIARTLLVASFTGIAGSAWATTYYVSNSGSNANNGTSTATAFQTLQYAAGLTNPSDTVYVMSGTYTVSCSSCDIVRIVRSGTSAAPITYSALAGTRPILNSSGEWQAIHIDASYITINGFEVEGDAQSVSQSQQDQQTAISAGNGIAVEPIPCTYGDGSIDCQTSMGVACPQTNPPACFIHGGTTPSHIVITNPAAALRPTTRTTSRSRTTPSTTTPTGPLTVRAALACSS